MKTLKTATVAELICELSERDEFSDSQFNDFLFDKSESSKHDSEVLTGYYFDDGSYCEIDNVGEFWLEDEWDKAGDYLEGQN